MKRKRILSHLPVVANVANGLKLSGVPKKAHGGRPAKLTPERQKLIVELLRRGNTREAAAAGAQIDRRTMYKWLAAYPWFKAAVEKAEHEAEVLFVQRIFEAATQSEVIEHFDSRGNLLTRRVKRDPKAAEWWLERRRRDTWRPPNQGIEVGGPDGGPVGAVNVMVWRPDPEWLVAFASSEKEMPPDVRLVTDPEQSDAPPDRARPGPVLLPLAPAAPHPDAEAGAVPVAPDDP